MLLPSENKGCCSLREFVMKFTRGEWLAGHVINALRIMTRSKTYFLVRNTVGYSMIEQKKVIGFAINSVRKKLWWLIIVDVVVLIATLTRALLFLAPQRMGRQYSKTVFEFR